MKAQRMKSHESFPSPNCSHKKLSSILLTLTTSGSWAILLTTLQAPSQTTDSWFQRHFLHIYIYLGGGNNTFRDNCNEDTWKRLQFNYLPLLENIFHPIWYFALPFKILFWLPPQASDTVFISVTDRDNHGNFRPSAKPIRIYANCQKPKSCCFDAVINNVSKPLSSSTL